MAEHNADFDPTRLERMERRLQALEDAEAIRNLKARYAALCDDNYDADGIAALFTEDATWDSPGLGRFEGREAIRGFFRRAAGIFSFAIWKECASTLVPLHRTPAAERLPEFVDARFPVQNPRHRRPAGVLKGSAACQSRLSCAIQASASASVAKPIAVVGGAPGLLTSTSKLSSSRCIRR